MEAFLSGGGAAGELLRSIDWSKNPVGPIRDWPTSLKSTVGIILHSRHPMFLWWGPELIQFYNDAYVPSFGVGKHPAAMGQRGRECWSEIWPIIGPQIDDAMLRGQPSWSEDALVPIFRNGTIEDVYWTYGYSPVIQEDGTVGGTLVVCTETTARVVAARRQQTARQLAEQTTLATSTEAVVPRALAVLATATDDLPWVLVQRWDAARERVERVAGFGLEPATPADAAVAARCEALVRSGERTAGPFALPEFGDSASVFLVTIASSEPRDATRVLAFGLGPRIPFDAAYREFLLQTAEHITLVEARVEAFRVRAATEAERNNLLAKAPIATALMVGPEHVFQLANPLYCQVVGRAPDELVGKSYRDAFPELVGTALPGILDRVYATGEPFVAGEMSVRLDRRGDGTLQDCFFRFNLEPIRTGDGAVYGMMAVAVDITDQVAARHALERSQVEREALLAELERASLAKDEFLAMLGHELRNPLAPIVTAVRLIKARDQGAPNRELRVIERQVDHLVRLVDDLLDVSKITRGLVVLQRETVEIHDVLVKAVEIAAVLFEQRAQRFVLDAPARGLAWYGDPVRLAQVVANLLTNAARYTPVGGHISLRAYRADDSVVIRVRDDGQGIAPELLPHVFDLFVQGRRNVDRTEGGLGLGLALVKNLVALHGGTVHGTSDGAGQGSEFVIRLPRATESAPARPTPRPVEIARTAASRRVLVVDDNADAADMLAELLREAGHEVVIANDPLVALAVLAKFGPEIAILDIGLPVMDGYELAGHVRATPAGARCRLIALTGYGQEHDRARSRTAGFELHLVKPIDAERLLEALHDERAATGTEPTP